MRNNSIKIAFKFENKNDLSHSQRSFTEFQFPFKIVKSQSEEEDEDNDESSEIFPNLNNPQIQEFILKLLFNKNFQKYTTNLEKLISKFDENLNT